MRNFYPLVAKLCISFDCDLNLICLQLKLFFTLPPERWNIYRERISKTFLLKPSQNTKMHFIACIIFEAN